MLLSLFLALLPAAALLSVLLAVEAHVDADAGVLARLLPARELED